MNLLQKILIPVSISIISILILMIFIFKFYFNANNTNSENASIELKQSDILNSIHRLDDKAINNSASYSGLKTIKRGINIYVNSNNIDSANKILKDKFVALSSDFKKITNKKFDIAFYANNGINLYRSWDNTKGDNVISNRNIIKDAINSQKTVFGIESDEWGSAIFGVTPVFDKESVFIGVVETRFSLIDLLSVTNRTNEEQIAIYVSNEAIEIATKLEKLKIMNNYSAGDYIPVIMSSKFNIENISKLDNFDQLNSVVSSDYSNFLYYSIPITDYNNTQTGIIIIQSDISSYLDSKQQVDLVVFISGGLALFLTILLLIIFGRKIIKHPVRNIIKSLNLLSKGITSPEVKIKTKDEIGEINNALNTLNSGYKRLSFFAKDIGDGNLDSEFSTLSDDDEIGNSLLEMRKKLITARNEEQTRKEDDDKRNWATKGYAEFGEILRQNNGNIKEFSIGILSNLVKYTKSNQGGLFILNDNDKNNTFLELVAAYAFDRRKFVDAEIQLGEGLVGTCAIEKETIFISKTPKDYINITSGLGAANPRSILIVPLKIEEKLFGVIELASFAIYEQYQIKFIEKLAESIASSLSTAKINIITAQLLEQSQQQQEEMSAQEEEMRQNMEEMQATQEETARKEAEMAGVLKAINNSSFVAEFDLNGDFININEDFIKILGAKSRTEIIGVNHKSFYDIANNDEDYNEFSNKIKSGKTIKTKNIINTLNGDKIMLLETYSSIYDADGEIVKVLNIAFDITSEM